MKSAISFQRLGRNQGSGCADAQTVISEVEVDAGFPGFELKVG
jgi:hypothetical protein